MKKLLIVAYSLFVVCMLLSCSGVYAKQDADNQFAFWYSLPDEYHHIMAELVAEYNKDKPLQTVTVRNFKEPNELYTALLEGNEYPDVALIDASWQEELIDKGCLVPVEDQMLKISSSIRVVAKMDTFKPLWNSCVYEDKLWTMPFFAVNHALMYNPEMFKDKAITKPPVSWGEIVDLGKKLTDPAQGTWGFYIPLTSSHKELAYLYQIFLWQAGGEVNSPDELKVAYNSELGQKALQFWVDVIHKYKIAPSRPEEIGKVAMLIGTPKKYLECSKKGIKIKVVNWPVKNKMVGDIEVTSVAIFKNTSSRVEKMWNFVYWITEFPQGLRWSMATHYLPANKQVTLSPGYFGYLEKNPGLRTFIALLDKGKAKPGLKDWHYEAIMGDLGEKIYEALSGRLTVQDALNKAALKANFVIQKGAGKAKLSQVE